MELLASYREKSLIGVVGVMALKKGVQLDKAKARLRFSQLQKKGSHYPLHVKISERLRHILQGFHVVASYRARPREVSIHSCGMELQISWIYPRIEGKELRFFKPKGFVKNRHGIEEPSKSSPEVALHDIPIVLIPGLAFDRRGHRLGSGKGFYDRTLAHYQGVKVGVACTLQVSSDDLPTEVHDIPMEYLVTENYILKPVNRIVKWKQQ